MVPPPQYNMLHHTWSREGSRNLHIERTRIPISPRNLPGVTDPKTLKSINENTLQTKNYTLKYVLTWTSKFVTITKTKLLHNQNSLIGLIRVVVMSETSPHFHPLGVEGGSYSRNWVSAKSTGVWVLNLLWANFCSKFPFSQQKWIKIFWALVGMATDNYFSVQCPLLGNANITI